MRAILRDDLPGVSRPPRSQQLRVALSQAGEPPRLIEMLASDVVPGAANNDRRITSEFVGSLDRTDDREPFQNACGAALERATNDIVEPGWGDRQVDGRADGAAYLRGGQELRSGWLATRGARPRP